MKYHLALTVKEMIWRLLRFFGWEISDVPRMTVLLYHSISESDDSFAVSPAAFEEQMKYIRRYLDVVPLARAFEHAAGKPVERDSVAVTFDDGYRDFIEHAQPILLRHRIPATLFVLASEPDRRDLGNEHPLVAPADIPNLDRSLVDIGSHALTHRKLSKIPIEEARAELIDSREKIQAAYGATPAYLAYPKGSFNDEVKEAARSAGYAGAVSVIQRTVHEADDPYALPRVQVDRDTTYRIFGAKLTIAADWYYFLWTVLRRPRKK